jgi:ABC-type polysaccharide/polyol phosphate transport system ATPase subunit
VASVILDNVTADFPIYGSSSFRKVLIGHAIGGLLRQSSGRNKRVTVRALDNISLEIRHGDQLGIVGHNGAGKSTLLRVLAGIYEPTQGKCIIDGRVSPLFITAPGLSVEDSGYDNIITSGLLLGMTREEIDRKIAGIEEFAGLGDFLLLPVRTYSVGMQIRLGFAIATAIDPEILLLDEGLGAGDERFTKLAQHRVEVLIERSNIMVLASHSRDLIRQMCNRAILMHHGRIIADGTPDEVLEKYHRLTTEEENPPAAPEPSAHDPSDPAGVSGSAAHSAVT